MGSKFPVQSNPGALGGCYLSYLEFIEQQFEHLGSCHRAVYPDVGGGAVRRREHGRLWGPNSI